MTVVKFNAVTPFSHLAKEILRQAVKAVYGDEPVKFVKSEPGPDVLCFGSSGGIHTLSPKQMIAYPNAVGFLVAAMRRLEYGAIAVPWTDCKPTDILYFDIEAHGVEHRWSMEPRDYFRLGQFSHGPTGVVNITTDYDEIISVIRSSRGVVAHNGHSYDLSALFGKDSTEPLEMAMENRIFDTMVFAALACPAPMTYIDRKGRVRNNAVKPEMALQWLGLDNLCYQLGLDGKEGDLKALAEEFGDFGSIPTDDPRFVAYAEQDVVSLQELTTALIHMHKPTEYDWREQLNAAIDAQNARNGFRVDIPVAQARVQELAERKGALLTDLQDNYGFPTTGKMPWRTTAGKAAVMKILADQGVTPATRPDWTKTKTGNISLGGETLIELTDGTDAEEVGASLAELMGQRSLAQLALDCTQPDGFVHPEITSLQRSGRKCLPETHRLLTRRGILHVDDVVVGDETLDMRNRWVPITEIHRYSSAEVHRYENDRVLLESTPEHRWVQWSESRGNRHIEPLDLSARRTIQLAPDAYPFDPYEMDLWPHMTERERTAAIVGFLVTDGHAANRHDSSGSRFVVYQTENKFYTKIRAFLGDLVAHDYSRSVWKHPKNTIHEMMLHTETIVPLLQEENLDWQGGLRNSPTLLPWVLSLSQSETMAFLTATYISDGNVKGLTPVISNLNPNKTDPLQVAAYRCGRRSNYRIYESPETYQRTGRVSLTRDRVSVRNLPQPENYVADVWCVSTETGTFTAWYPEGRWSGPYLTGNSTTKPGLTVWTSRGKGAIEKTYFIPDNEDHVLMGFDFSQADARIVAAYSGDREFAKRFAEGVDAHELTGRVVFGDELYDTDPPKFRHTAKNLGHAYAYRAGPKKLSAMSGESLDVAQRFVDAMQRAYPLVTEWQDHVTYLGECGIIVNDWGRRMVIEQDRSYTQSPALMGQSGTRELMVDALIRMLRFDMRLITWLKIQVHDELVFSIPKTELYWAPDKIVELMECEWEPSDGSGQKMKFPVSRSKPATNWFESNHD